MLRARERFHGPRFEDRRDGGRRLAAMLERYRGRDDVVVLGLPRGGVPVAFEVALALEAPLDVFIVRKLGVPGHDELAMGAIASGGVRVVNDDLVEKLDIPRAAVDARAAEESVELARREIEYRGTTRPTELEQRVIILVDDGLATGATMRAAASAVRARGPSRIVVAAPVGAVETCEAIREWADEVVCLSTPHPFRAVGLWYETFDQTTDDEVRELLASAREVPRARIHRALRQEKAGDPW